MKKETFGVGDRVDVAGGRVHEVWMGKGVRVCYWGVRNGRGEEKKGNGAAPPWKGGLDTRESIRNGWLPVSALGSLNLRGDF